MRDRLIELIKDSLNKHIGESCLLAENIAVYLLANGVIVTTAEVVRCKDCKHRKTDRCRMYYEDFIEWDDDGYHELELVTHDGTTDDGFCELGERSDT